jgi:hypothetical protein
MSKLCTHSGDDPTFPTDLSLSGESTYSNPKSFVNFLLPPLTKGRVGVG